ncbi:chemotaxis protein CheB [Kovacikia minuta CCNUW1]|uniref:chemotaxis protein CheB n=1 Tax=Kovacikia minuta TaxID=2931930 RepID=UPI001CCB15D9|nr:chemotaxis protein CheB [Kovacikia minuta]UBF28921.1 chemotaxis protein CheB [Kovacikia minuta CCNUW1]
MAFEIIVIGTSLGGLSALRVLLGSLPRDFPLAIAVVQHRYKDFNNSLSSFLQQFLSLPIKDVEDKDPIQPGKIYLAPADYHLLVEPGYFSLSIDEPVSFARPSIDVLFESAADTYRDRTVGIVLTGANHDGARGLSSIKTANGLTIVQDPASAESNIMPLAAIAATCVDAILPLAEIAPYLMNRCASVRS